MSKREIPDFMKSGKVKFEDLPYSKQLLVKYTQLAEYDFGYEFYVDEENWPTVDEYDGALEWCVKKIYLGDETTPNLDISLKIIQKQVNERLHSKNVWSLFNYLYNHMATTSRLVFSPANGLW